MRQARSYVPAGIYSLAFNLASAASGAGCYCASPFVSVALIAGDRNMFSAGLLLCHLSTMESQWALKKLERCGKRLLSGADGRRLSTETVGFVRDATGRTVSELATDDRR